MLQWLLVSISCPSCSATDGWCVTAATAGHQRYLCSHCRKTWQLQFTLHRFSTR
ncbi:IS1 family transposase [Klebsiella pneumoniae]|uniref:IS1 family transposase n=1 Tax=Klebsiella pneumoniae TaxID=573 RepID=UPI003D7B06E2